MDPFLKERKKERQKARKKERERERERVFLAPIPFPLTYFDKQREALSFKTVNIL